MSASDAFWSFRGIKELTATNSPPPVNPIPKWRVSPFAMVNGLARWGNIMKPLGNFAEMR